jgi:RNA polymerase sigma-70 factor, ECF subfamily
MPDLALPHDEQRAIARTLEGDLDAFNKLVVKYERLAYSVAYRMLQSEEAAADAVQESFIKAFRALPSLKSGAFKSWLMRIVVNTCYDVLRVKKRYTLESIADDPIYDEGDSTTRQLVDSHESPHDFVERMELGEQIELGLRALSPDQRLMVALYDIHGHSYEEISVITGLPLGTIKSRLSRARARLRDFLLQQPELLPVALRF